jgi:hypothetical protein
MSDDAQARLDRIIEELREMEGEVGSGTGAGGMLHAARTIHQETVRLTAFGGRALDDDGPLSDRAVEGRLEREPRRDDRA